MIVNEYTSDAERNMKKIVESLKNEFKKIMGPKANSSIFDTISADDRGLQTPLPHLSTITVIDDKTITIKPFDYSILQNVDKAIQNTNIGFSTKIEGKLLRITMPFFSSDRIKECVKKAHNVHEEHSIKMQEIRRDVLDNLKNDEKMGNISEETFINTMKALQELTKKYTTIMDDLIAQKEREFIVF